MTVTVYFKLTVTVIYMCWEIHDSNCLLQVNSYCHLFLNTYKIKLPGLSS
jgi:hypothetical protein